MDMKKSALRKEFYREIRGSLQRFLSILLISALGVAFFAGLRACKTDMLLSADAFYDRTNMMDLRIVSSMGLTQDDVRAICAADGVRAAEGVFVQDALFSDGDEDVVVRLYSMTEQVNTCLLTGGRMPQGVSECAADEFFLSARGLKLGDTLQLESGSGDGLSDTLRKTQVTIVGSVSTGRYLSSARGSSTIGNGKVAGYLVLPAENIIPEYYTEIGVLFEGTRELNSYGDEYDAVVEQCMEALQAVRPERELARLQQLQQEAYRGLDEKESEIALQEQELRKAGQELKEAQQTIADGFSEAERGREKLAAERNGLPELFAGAEAELTAGRRALAEAWEKYNVQEAPVLAAREEYDSYVRQLSDISQGPEDIRKILEVLGIDETGIIEAEQELEAARTKLEAQETALQEKEKELEAQKLQAEEKLAAAERELAGTEQELRRRESELLAAKQEYNSSLEENQNKIAKAYEAVEEGRKEIASMEAPEWYLLDRNTIESCVSFAQDADRMDAVSLVFPGIFFLVAALVSLTTMTRMVDEERTKIGTLKALGYGTADIAGKYIKYALYATLTGSVIGVLAGGKIFPYIVITTYKLVYTCLPEVVMPLHPVYSVVAVLIAVLCTVAATLAACLRALREQPAELIRPAAPKAGKRILLERVGILWRHISFSRKATLRNMFRYKKRFFMTVIGIGCCMALLLVGYGLKDSIGVMAHIQYGELCRYDISVSLDSRAPESGFAKQFGSMPGVSGASPYREAAVDLTSGATTKSVRLIVLPDAEAFDAFFVFRDRNSGEQYSINDAGIFLSEKAAKMLGVRAGDSVRLQRDAADFREVRIGEVTENYIFHYAFMTESLYRELYGEAPVYNGCYLRLEPDASEEGTAAALLRDYDEVASVLVTGTLQRQVDEMLRSLNVITWVLIVCAGMLAFIVLYNLSNINITERRRELATLKVLGFYDSEVSGYVYRENVLLTFFGILLGIALGRLLHGFVITTCEVDMVMFGHIIKPVSYLLSSLLTILFAALIGILMHFKLKRIDMVESLKSTE